MARRAFRNRGRPGLSSRCHVKKGAVPIEHSDATSLLEEFNAETAPATRFQGPLPVRNLSTAAGRGDIMCCRKSGDIMCCRESGAAPGTSRQYRFRPAPNREQVQSAGAAIVRKDGRTRRGSITSWDCWKYAPRIGIKRGRGVSPSKQVIGNPNQKAVLRPCCVPPKNKRDITRTDNYYT